MTTQKRPRPREKRSQPLTEAELAIRRNVAADRLIKAAHERNERQRAACVEKEKS